MWNSDPIRSEYFDWMCKIVHQEKCDPQISYLKLLSLLHTINFRYSIRNDSNREGDGTFLRYRFSYSHQEIDDAESYLRGPCSVLEMILALALRMEETIMDDPRVGNRTGQWFWQMIVNLGLGSMVDAQFDEQFVRDTIDRFLDRKYEPNGKGGLFTIKNRDTDLRKVEIWYQMCWYLDNIA